MNAAPVLAPAAQPRSAAQPRLRITRRGRAVLMTLIAIPIVIAALFFALNGGGAMAGNGAGVALEQVTIEPGQTLWGLAEQYAPHSDPRDFVADVVNLNGIVDVLEAGQVVDIPAQYTN
ncbi:hypothetical protein EYE40_01240 [Glaciihabitans arcticus]|uniref:LysM domain-containing protein n=1 Tax=Glaciihabitans arcticus TaxID=2668039 RepID=A0A4V2JF86_9MICO|nr:hypothetical protein EYE40_01240 [Glaciihabitans arcticus]